MCKAWKFRDQCGDFVYISVGPKPGRRAICLVLVDGDGSSTTPFAFGIAVTQFFQCRVVDEVIPGVDWKLQVLWGSAGG